VTAVVISALKNERIRYYYGKSVHFVIILSIEWLS
jgi:hypothetical protein